MKKTVLSALLISVLLTSCEKEEVSEESNKLPCPNVADLTPEFTEDPNRALTRANGSTGIRIKKIEGVENENVQAVMTRGVKNYDTDNNLNNGPLHLSYFGPVYNDDEYWYYSMDFYATNSDYIVDVFFTCEEGSSIIESNHINTTISAPNICDALKEQAFIPNSIGVASTQSSVDFNFNINYGGDTPMGIFVSEENLTIRATPTFNLIEETPKIITVTNTPLIFPISTTFDLFDLTGYDSATWPASHSNSNAVFIEIEMQICNEWHTAGSIQWFTQ